MNTATKFLFETTFEHGAAGPAGRSGRSYPRYTDDDLAAARGEGQEAGHQKGYEQAKREREQAAAAALGTIAERLGRIDEVHARALEAIKADAARLAGAIAAKLAPELIRRQPAAEIEAMIAECLAQMPAEPRVVVRVAEPLVDELAARIDEVAGRAGFSGAVVLLGEPDISVGDCRVEWADGGAERDLGVLLQGVAAAIERYCRAQHERAGVAPAAASAPADPGGEDDADADAAKTPPPDPARPAAGAAEADEDDPLAEGLPPLSTAGTGTR